MEEFIARELAALNERLEEIARTAENNLQYAEQSYKAVQLSLQKLKHFITGYAFEDETEEIRFFKVLKPQFLKQLIYYWKLFHFEAEKPKQDKDALQAWYRQKIDYLNLFFTQHHHLYIYYRMMRSDQDRQYFTRNAESCDILPEYSLEIDHRFCTIHSLKLARLQAYEMLNEFLLAELRVLQHGDSIPDNLAALNRPDATWTDSKVDLIELGYAIQSRGSVNQGKADLKLVMQTLEFAFNIVTGNYYAVFQQNIRIRKKNRTVYLNKLRDALDNRMDNTDEQ